jgi:hypothetical protein
MIYLCPRIYSYAISIIVISMIVLTNIVAETWVQVRGDQRGVIRGYIDRMKGKIQTTQEDEAKVDVTKEAH